MKTTETFSGLSGRSAPVYNPITRILGLGDDVPRIQNPKLQKTTGQNPRWYIRPYVPLLTANGVEPKQQRIFLGVCAEVTKRHAIVLKNRAMEKINRHQWIVSSQISFGEFIDRWLKTYVRAKGNLSASTKQKYESHVESRIRPAFGALAMGEVTTERIDEWLTGTAAEGISYNTRNDLLKTLSGIFTRARKWGLWKETNPCADATVGRAREAREKRKLSMRQLHAILELLPRELAMICDLALLTLRISEVLGLQEKHLDFISRRILVCQRYYCGDIDVCKSAKSRRPVPMGLLADELKAMCTGDPERYLFADWTYNKGQAILRETAKKLGLYWEGFGFHQFRREAKTGIGAEGLDPFQVMKLSGHAGADESLLYTLSDDDAQERAVRQFQEKVRVN